MRRNPWLLAVLAVPLCVSCGSSSGFSNNKGDSGPGNGTESGTGPDGTIPGYDGGGTVPDGTTPGMDGSTGSPETSTGTDSGGITPSTGITITVEPDGSGDAAALLSAIEGAQTEVDVEMYLLTNSKYISALTGLVSKGKKVRVILNETFPSGTSSSDTNGSATSGTYSQLKSGGVSVQWGAPAFTYTHEKAVIIDPAGGSDSQVWVMTMNLDTDAPKYNREFLALDTNAADIAEAEAIFNEDFGTSSGTPTGNLVVAPSPPNNAVTVLVDLINSATTSVQMESEEFDDSGTDTEELVFKALAAKAGKGVSVELVLQDSTDSSQTSAVSALEAAGAKIVGYPCSESGLDIHAKALVVDGTRAYVGSENFSGGSLGYNRELGVYFTGSQAATVASTITKDFAGGSTYSSSCSE
jgi:cardiolipin synthase A/B